MTQFNLIQNGELQTRLAKGLQISERTPAPVLSSEIQAIVVLEDLSHRNLASVEESPAIYSAFFGIAGVVGNYSLGTVSVPVGSSFVLRILEGWSTVTINVQHAFGWMDPAFIPAGAISPRPHDLRNISLPVPVVRFGTDAVSRIQFIDTVYRTAAQLPNVYYRPISPPLVLPGECFCVQHLNTGSNMEAGLVFEVIPST